MDFVEKVLKFNEIAGNVGEMNLNNAVKYATCTEGVIQEVHVNKDILNGVIGSMINAGELLDQIKKNTFYNRDIPYSLQTDKLSELKKFVNNLQQDYNDTSIQMDKEILSVDSRLFHAALGIATESIELLQCLQKSYTTNQPIDIVNFREELFDVMWYFLIAHDAMQLDPNTTLQIGFDKLRHRYPEKFDEYSANNRDIIGERKILEN